MIFKPGCEKGAPRFSGDESTKVVNPDRIKIQPGVQEEMLLFLLYIRDGLEVIFLIVAITSGALKIENNVIKDALLREFS